MLIYFSVRPHDFSSLISLILSFDARQITFALSYHIV